MKGVLLVNLGSPKSTDLDDIKSYLDQFLMDERVMDFPKPLRSLIVRGIILKKRPPKTQANYKRIWWEEGSPLIVISERLQAKIKQQVQVPVALAMRYAEPSLETGLRELAEQKVDEAFVIPLFPQYAMATIGTASAKIGELQKKYFQQMQISVMPPFYNHPDYIEVLSESIREKWEEWGYEHLLFSYHGIPERHIRKSDVTDGHCKMDAHCCQTPSPAHKFCYRHQCFETTRLVVEKLGLKKEEYTLSFQSRLGPDRWLQPYTDKTLEKLGKKGVKKLAVATPAFVADCIETLDEIAREGKEDFVKNGGDELQLIPCLHDRMDWAGVLAKWIGSWVQSSGKTEA